MSIKTAFQNAAVTGFKIFDSVNIVSTYTSIGTKSYDATTGTVTSSDTDYNSLNFLFTKYKKMEIDNEHILKTDVKGLIPYDNFPSITPKVGDVITTSTSLDYSVVNFGVDPSDALYTFQLRLKDG